MTAPEPRVQVTGREMCETISGYLRDRFGESVPPENIWNASPTGELAHVFWLYRAAQDWYAGRDS